jgi:hypothetical protein
MILADIIVLKSKLIFKLLLVINNISKVLKKVLFRAVFTNKKKNNRKKCEGKLLILKLKTMFLFIL